MVATVAATFDEIAFLRTSADSDADVDAGVGVGPIITPCVLIEKV